MPTASGLLIFTPDFLSTLNDVLAPKNLQRTFFLQTKNARETRKKFLEAVYRVIQAS